MVKCEFCFDENDDNAVFCKKCGKKIEYLAYFPSKINDLGFKEDKLIRFNKNPKGIIEKGTLRKVRKIDYNLITDIKLSKFLGSVSLNVKYGDKFKSMALDKAIFNDLKSFIEGETFQKYYYEGVAKAVDKPVDLNKIRKYCTKCSLGNDYNSNICIKCGSPLDKIDFGTPYKVGEIYKVYEGILSEKGEKLKFVSKAKAEPDVFIILDPEKLYIFTCYVNEKGYFLFYKKQWYLTQEIEYSDILNIDEEKGLLHFYVKIHLPGYGVKIGFFDTKRGKDFLEKINQIWGEKKDNISYEDKFEENSWLFEGDQPKYMIKGKLTGVSRSATLSLRKNGLLIQTKDNKKDTEIPYKFVNMVIANILGKKYIHIFLEGGLLLVEKIEVEGLIPFIEAFGNLDVPVLLNGKVIYNYNR